MNWSLSIIFRDGDVDVGLGLDKTTDHSFVSIFTSIVKGLTKMCVIIDGRIRLHL